MLHQEISVDPRSSISEVRGQERFADRAQRAYRLVEAKAEASGCDFRRVRRLADTMLDIASSAPERRGAISGLNGDGAPLQLCVTCQEGPPKFRLIADPASDEVVAGNRHDRSKKAFQKVCAQNGAAELQQAVNQLFQHFEPEDGLREKFTHGLLWIGAAADSPGVAVYIDASVYEAQDAWRRVAEWLPSSQSAQAGKNLPQVFDSWADLASVGVEGVDALRHRLKLYARARHHLPQGFMGLLAPQLEEFVHKGCFHEILGDSFLTKGDILFNVGVHPVSGEIVDGKIDLGLAGLGHSRKELSEAIHRCCRKLGMTSFPFLDLMRRFDLNYSFLGFGASRSGRLRMNVYMKAAL